MTTLDQRLAARANKKWGAAPDISEPIAFHQDGQPALQTVNRQTPAKPKRTGYIDTTVFQETENHFNRIIHTLSMRHGRKVTKSELLERMVAMLGKEEGIQ